jgi:hypothetical protein
MVLLREFSRRFDWNRTTAWKKAAVITLDLTKGMAHENKQTLFTLNFANHRMSPDITSVAFLKIAGK